MKGVYVIIFANFPFKFKEWKKYLTNDRILKKNIVELPALSPADREKIKLYKQKNRPAGSKICSFKKYLKDKKK